jgi:hypothetical protein
MGWKKHCKEIDGGFGLDIGFTDHLHMQLVSRTNYNTLTESHTSNIAVPTAHTKFCLQNSTFNWLSTASNSFLHTPLQISSTRPAQTTLRSFPYDNVSAGMCLPRFSLAAAVYSGLSIFCLATDVFPLSVSRPLRRNECCVRVVRYQRLFLWFHNSCFEQMCHVTCIYINILEETSLFIFSVLYQTIRFISEKIVVLILTVLITTQIYSCQHFIIRVFIHEVYINLFSLVLESHRF